MDEDYGEECGHTSEHEVTTGREAKEQDWQKAWYDGDCKDANRDTTKWLKENVDKLTGGKSGCRILVPMCGAVRDMHWLMEHGHKVIGIELVDKALRMFLERHSIEYETSDVPSIKDGKCYKSKDGQVVLYRCNIFDMDMSLVGKVDGVWDSGAMTDIPPAERIQYGEIILSALSPGGRILAETFTFGEIKDTKGGSEQDHIDGQTTSTTTCQYGVDHSEDDHQPSEGQDCHHHHGDDHGNTCKHGDDHSSAQEEDYDFPCRPVEMRDFEKMYGNQCSIEMLFEKDSTEYGAEEWGPNWWAKDRLHLVIVKEQSSDGAGSCDSRKRVADYDHSEETPCKKTTDETEK